MHDYPACAKLLHGDGSSTTAFPPRRRLRARHRVEAHPIPEHPIFIVEHMWHARMQSSGSCDANRGTLSEGLEKGMQKTGEADLRNYLKLDKTYWSTYKVLDILQKVFYLQLCPGGLR
ncbi:hypothetical protein KSP40_PGU010163 [Platanthera guangdongensis]|uniref:Uncharacterized protein n=1 Tax=Platanthera guangdongensis TaxID=2320717 RepID=A0ABR2MHX1_9ASPA